MTPDEATPHWITEGQYVPSPVDTEAVIVRCSQHMGSVFWRWVAEERLIAICDGMYDKGELR